MEFRSVKRCKLHSESQYIYLPRRAFSVCLGCVEAGFYIEEITDEAHEEVEAQTLRRIQEKAAEQGETA